MDVVAGCKVKPRLCLWASLLGLVGGTMGTSARKAARPTSVQRGAARLLDGKAVAAEIRQELGERTKVLQAQGLIPGLAVVLVGQRPDSESYVRGKTKAAEEVGCQVFNINFPDSVEEVTLIDQILELNEDPRVHGILVQLPLPHHINEQNVLDSISVNKDADGLCSANLGLLARPSGNPLALPCTPAGCMEILRRYDVPVEGKNCVILGRSAIVGMPMMLLMLKQHGTVRLCHSRTDNVAKACSDADILVAAVGCPGFVKGDWLKPGVVVLDVGINRVPDATRKRGYRLQGDVDFESVALKASLITPVPGGVGPMTVAMLLNNTVALAESVLRAKKLRCHEMWKLPVAVGGCWPFFSQVRDGYCLGVGLISICRLRRLLAKQTEGRAPCKMCE